MESVQAFLVTCLCAEWCGTCREYRPSFEALSMRFPQANFLWVDVEDEPELAGDVDVENFPTLVVQRDQHVLFCGPMLPQVSLLERMLESLLEMDAESAARFATGTAERANWQGVADIRARLAERN